MSVGLEYLTSENHVPAICATGSVLSHCKLALTSADAKRKANTRPTSRAFMLSVQVLQIEVTKRSHNPWRLNDAMLFIFSFPSRWLSAGFLYCFVHLALLRMVEHASSLIEPMWRVRLVTQPARSASDRFKYTIRTHDKHLFEFMRHHCTTIFCNLPNWSKMRVVLRLSEP